MILESLECSRTNPAYAALSAAYDRVIGLAESLLAPRAAYVLVDQHSGRPALGEAASCAQVVYCLVTVGEAVSQQSAAYFQNGLYTEGLILDAIANFTLFECSRQLYQKIADDAREAGLGLTRRLSPGDGGLATSCQRAILEQFAACGALGITLTDGDMLNPLKSLAYLYGADAALTSEKSDHVCSTCTSTSCKLRVPTTNRRPAAAKIFLKG